MKFQEQYNAYIKEFDAFAKDYFQIQKAKHQSQHSNHLNQVASELGVSINADSMKAHNSSSLKVWEAMEYSFFGGGKRFRPTLCLAVADALGESRKKILPYALSIEMIHTYSLIHDDLPCMDNDDVRRGRPTSHKVYGEAMALLAGDALLTEAFRVLSNCDLEPDVCRKLTELLATRSGVCGMISGQATDLQVTQKEATLEDLILTHKNKTSALIESTVLGVGVLTGKSVDLEKFGILVGLGFQVADDLLDYQEKKEKNNFVHIWGQEKSEDLLNNLTQKSCLFIEKYLGASEFLFQLVMFNKNRKF